MILHLDIKMKPDAYIFYLLMLNLYVEIYCDIIQRKYREVPGNFDKFVAGPVSVSSLIECSAKCTTADGCVGVLYSPTLKACQLSSAVLSNPSARNDPVWTFYLSGKV